jgi:hypothetical protein
MCLFFPSTMLALHCRIVERSSQVPLSNYHIQYGLDSHQTGKIRRELQKLQIFQWTLKVLESVSFFSRGQKVSKNSKHWSNEKGPSSTTKIVQRNNSERSNATPQCIWIQIFLFCYCYCSTHL